MMKERGMVILGAGEAGARAAVELRDQGWSGQITLIGKEVQLPYERPPLSKSVLASEEEPSLTCVLDKDKLHKYNISFISNGCAVKIDRDHHVILLKDNQEIQYERLLLATGAQPRRLSMDGSDTTQVLYLRTYIDALTIRSQLESTRHIVIIGGGFIGLEVAASAKVRGCSVTVIEVGPRILMRGVPEEIADIVEARHRKAGVNFKLGVSIKHIEHSQNVHRITMADGTIIQCDSVIAGIGVTPDTILASESGLIIDNGIAVNEKLLTSDADIFAAGDCCSFPHILFQGKRIRLEAWRNALDQGTHAAINMLGSENDYTAIPWFWSDQYELSLQVAGLSELGKTTVKRELRNADALFFHLAADGRLVSASGVGSSIAKDIRISEMLIEKQAIVDPLKLADPEIKLKSILKGI